ncbi:DNase/tRNase domain of colicin-like bacteriocin [Seinonella peptonophila]|uniref:DNase/tRNase domain of colicin-like bacteriocin n=1 Tax=Seinonella peptonophila TaxID=112248 RepID=A0A1M4Y7Q8_9BACL|nr:HNH endonuclease [Seinonella peptonophila]SHF01801.1 DNase/tRNase domain of colicin-like bacteriocin [Seinonella peptonophila]
MGGPYFGKYKLLSLFLCLILATCSLTGCFDDPNEKWLEPRSGKDLHSFFVKFVPILYKKKQLDADFQAKLTPADQALLQKIEKGILSPTTYTPMELSKDLQKRPTTFWQTLTTEKQRQLMQIQREALQLLTEARKLPIEDRIKVSQFLNSFTNYIGKEISLNFQWYDLIKAVDPKNLKITTQPTAYFPKLSTFFCQLIGVQQATATPITPPPPQCNCNVTQTRISPQLIEIRTTCQCTIYQVYQQILQEQQQAAQIFQQDWGNFREQIISQPFPPTFQPPKNVRQAKQLLQEGMKPQKPLFIKKDGQVYVIPSWGGRAITMINGKYANGTNEKTNFPYDERGYPRFKPIFKGRIQPADYLKDRPAHNGEMNKQLRAQYLKDPRLRKQILDYLKSEYKDDYQRRFKQVEAEILKGQKPSYFTWDHHYEPGVLQLVGSNIHGSNKHTGGFAIWGAGQFK